MKKEQRNDASRIHTPNTSIIHVRDTSIELQSSHLHRSLFDECYRRRRSSPVRASPLRRIPSPPPLANSSASAPMLLHTSSARNTVTIKDAANTSDMPACSSSSGSRSHRYSMSKSVFPSGLSPPAAVGSWSASSK